MIIKGNNLSQLIKGALTYKTTQEGTLPLRFTEKQMTVYEKRENFRLRSRTSSGMKLAFRTDASKLNLKCRLFKACAPDLYGFDLTENGLLTGHKEGRLTDIEGTVLQVSFPLSGVNVCKELFLSSFAETEIISMELTDASYVSPAEDKPHLLMMGDSITQGYIAHFPSFTYPNRLAALLEMDVLNQGIGGDTFRAETLDCDLKSWPDIIIIAYGTNDWSHMENPEINAKNYLEKAVKIWPEKQIFVLTPLWRRDFDKKTPHGMSLWVWRDQLADIASNWPSITVISGQELFPETPELFADRYLHPNDNGFVLLAERLANKMKGFIH